MLALVLALFFGARATRTRDPHPLGWPPGQRACQFLPSTLDGFFGQARDLREQAIPTRTNTIGLNRNVPATLLLIEAAEQQIDLPMPLLIWMKRFLLARDTLARANF